MAMPGRHERPSAAGRRRRRPRGRAGRARRRPGGRRSGAAGRGRAGRPARPAHRPDLRSGPHRRMHRAGSSRIRTDRAQIGWSAGLPPPMERPPSVDALARSLAGAGCRTRSLVDVARQAIADGAVDDAAGARRGAAPHAADAGRQRHRRAAAHQPRPGAARPPPAGAGAVARARPGDRRARLAPAGRRPAASPGCAAPRRRSSSTTTPPPCCSCSPPSPPGATCR